MEDYKVVAIYQVDQPMFLTDPPGPGACEHVTERLGLADPGGRPHRLGAVQRLRPGVLY